MLSQIPRLYSSHAKIFLKYTNCPNFSLKNGNIVAACHLFNVNINEQYYYLIKKIAILVQWIW